VVRDLARPHAAEFADRIASDYLAAHGLPSRCAVKLAQRMSAAGFVLGLSASAIFSKMSRAVFPGGQRTAVPLGTGPKRARGHLLGEAESPGDVGVARPGVDEVEVGDRGGT